MNANNPYILYSTVELSHMIEDLDEDENPEEYAAIAEEIARRTAAEVSYSPPSATDGASHSPQSKTEEVYYSPRGATILVLGIVGLVLSMVCGILGVIVALVAWSMGDTAIKQMKAAGYTNQVEINNVRVGRTCGAAGAFIFLGIITLKWLAGR